MGNVKMVNCRVYIEGKNAKIAIHEFWYDM